MPAPSKIQDAAEVRRWFAEGRPYAWMVEQYERKYNIATTTSLWANYRRRHGLDPRLVRDTALIPWRVARRHRWAYPLALLRVEARRRAGVAPSATDAGRLAKLKAVLAESDLVVHYDPDTDAGFHLIPRGPHDHDLIHEPTTAPEATP